MALHAFSGLGVRATIRYLRLLEGWQQARAIRGAS
jgi:hypothetical protein